MRALDPVNTSTPETHAAAAERHEARAMEAERRLSNLVHHHVAGLLGPAVAGALARPLEEVTENYGEALYHRGRAADAMEMELQARNSQVGEYRQALVHCAERILARYHKVRRPVPDDLEQIVAIAAVATGWDYLWPPADERHRHDTDSGGACRNPMCKYLSDNVEPF